MPDVGTMGPWPLPDERHYFFAPDNSPFAHSGEVPPDDVAVRYIQQKIGAEVTGHFDAGNGGMVSAWREFHGQDEGDYVDAALWLVMDQTPDPTGTEVPT